MSAKEQRHNALRELVEGESLRTQREIAERLRELGYEVAQPTLSRDCEELGLRRIRDEDGKLRYVLGTPEYQRLQRLGLLLGEFVLSMIRSGNLLLLKTPPGAAGPVSCVIDGAPLDEVAGTLAGEDTILVVAADGLLGKDLEKRFRTLIEQQAAATTDVDLEEVLADAHSEGHEAEDRSILSALRSFRLASG